MSCAICTCHAAKQGGTWSWAANQLRDEEDVPSDDLGDGRVVRQPG
jgi:hypothetical protein